MPIQQTIPARQTADVVIVGGGVIGLSIARALALRGMKNVMLIERAYLGAEASSAAGGILAPQAEADRNDDFFRLTRQSRDLYPALAATLREETGIEIELDVRGTIYLAFTKDDEREIEKRYAWQTRAGLPVDKLSAEEVRQAEPCVAENVRSALRLPLDIQVENRRLVTALAASAEKQGVQFLIGTNVESLRVGRGRVEGVETSRGFVAAPAVVLAAGAWTSFISASSQSNQRLPRVSIEPVRGQMLCFATRPPIASHVLYSPRGYVVPRLDGRLLAGSTCEHAGFDKSVTAGGIHSVLSNALEIAPRLRDLSVADMWAGLRPRAEDDLPVLGPAREIEGLFYATGHYRSGILLAPITGELIAEAIVRNVLSPLLGAFSPKRFALRAVSKSQ